MKYSPINIDAGADICRETWIENFIQLTEINEPAFVTWIAKLRSGEINQIGGRLRRGFYPGMCCLGVACEVAPIGEWVNSDLSPDNFAYRVSEDDTDPDGQAGKNYCPPEAVINWYSPSSSASAVINSLAEFNDSLNLDFVQIADMIADAVEAWKEAHQ